MIETEQLVREPAERKEDEIEESVAIALSGGGYRAMLFHTGALWRLGELGFFSRRVLYRLDKLTGAEVPVGPLARVSSVSGGSIVSAMLGLRFEELASLSSGDFVDRYRAQVVEPIRSLAGTTLAGASLAGAWPVIKNILLPGRVNAHVARAYDRILYKGKTLQDLPVDVRFVINASNLQSGALWRFSRPFLWDWKVGKIERPHTPLAIAVGASSAFPPVLAPAVLSMSDKDYVPGTGAQLQKAPFTTTPTLVDGGVYDNLGLETCFKGFRTLLVSNASKPFEPRASISSDWASIGARCLRVMDNQVLSQRKRQLMEALISGQRFGAFWDIQQDVLVHACPDALPCPPDRTAALARVPTDLAKKPSQLQEQIINWGYANTDAAVRSRFNARLPAATAFPYPSSGL